jgi:hypothetical protein
VFDKGSAMAMVVAHSKDKPSPPSSRTELEVPQGLERVIMQCLEKDPMSRPPDARALSKMLGDAAPKGHWSEDAVAEWWRLHGPPPAETASAG